MDATKRLEQLEAKAEAQAKMIAHYEKKLGIGGETPLAMKGFLAYQKLMEQQVKHIDNFIITEDILSGKKSADALWERTEKMHSELPEKISMLNKLKTELQIEYDPNEGKVKVGAISPQNIASLIYED